MEYVIYAIAAWPLIAVITVVLWCRIIHNDKAREAGQGKFEA